MLNIPQEYVEAFGGADALAAAVTEFMEALAAHALTVGEAAPSAPMLVEAIVKGHGGAYTIVDPPPPAAPEPPLPDTPSIAGVVAERERRLAQGFDFDFAAMPGHAGDPRGVHRFGTTAADMEGWDEVTKLAAAMIAVGNAAGTILIVTNTGPATVTALEWQQVLLAAATFRQPIWAASFVLQALDPIPDAYRDDAYWP